jgi:hypothetical protein
MRKEAAVTTHDPARLDIDRSAPAVVRRERIIRGDVERIWAVQADIDRWTSWRSDVQSAELHGDLTPGTTFDWVTGPLEITSTIHTVERAAHLLWSGPATGITGVHRWDFEMLVDGVRVVTEESWSGPLPAADPERAVAMLIGHLDLWLDDLARKVERG